MTVTEKERSTVVAGSYDTVVCGGGFAGIAAALAARRNGAKTLLIEREFLLGGLGTLGLVTIYLPLCDGNGRQVSFGIAEELLKLSIADGHEGRYPEPWLSGGTVEEKKRTRYAASFNANVFAIKAEKLLVSEGVELLYGTQICGTLTESGRITHLLIENKSGRQAIEAKTFVDCTGDADICAFSGENTVRSGKGNVLAAWYYTVDENGHRLVPCGRDYRSDEWERFTGLDGKEITGFMIKSHDVSYSNFIAAGGVTENHRMAAVAGIPQLRMTRRVRGCATMTLADDHRFFADSVGAFGDWTRSGRAFELPFGCLHGEKISNLITAGRCISADDPMWEITRVIPVCSVTGEAAGTAAAMTDDFITADVGAIAKRLSENGVLLHL